MTVKIMSSLTELERAVLEMLLAGDHPILECLRKQLSLVQVTRREWTGVGFFTDLVIPESAEPAKMLPGRATIGDVLAEIAGLDHGAGFVLFIEDGKLDFLEGYSYEEPWSEARSEYSLRYRAPNVRDLNSLDAKAVR